MAPHSHNIIGDIHGRDVWKRVVDDSLVNVFVGDFFDPYSDAITFDECRENFLEILDYKRRHPASVLLWGNHELHYLLQDEMSERYSRFDDVHADDIQRLLEENSDCFDGVAYSVADKCLVSHAGVGRYWYMRWIERYSGQSPDYVAEQINNLWNINKLAFSFYGNKKYPYDDDGSTQSPLWIRPWVLEACNLFENTAYGQVFGHTQCDSIWEQDGLVCVDCLRAAPSVGAVEQLSLRV